MSRSKVTNEELIELVKDGLSVPQIASAKGMADCSVRERLKKLNIQAANGHRATQGYKDEDMRRLAAEGLS